MARLNRERVWLTESNFGESNDSGKRTLCEWLSLLHGESENERKLWDTVAGKIKEVSGLDLDDYEDLDDAISDAGLTAKLVCEIYHSTMDELYGFATVREDWPGRQHPSKDDSRGGNHSDALYCAASSRERGVACDVRKEQRGAI